MEATHRRAGWTAVLLVGVFAGGIAFLGAFNAAVQWTNTESFCISCHEMEENAYRELKLTAHDLNRTGVRASCADCHVPREWHAKMAAKLRASKDLLGHFIGTIDTPEKYNARRLAMAQAVWSYMKATNSRECQDCHSLSAMALDEQQGRARRKHQRMLAKGQSCIDCHKGIAHRLPDEYDTE